MTMRTSLRIAPVIIAAALLGWFARSASVAVDASPSPQPLQVAETPAVIAGELPARVQHVAAVSGTVGERNLFAFRERVVPPPSPVVVHVTAPAPELVSAPIVEAAPASPPAPRFPYRFIGSFGTRQRQLAAFSRDGEVITARAGQKVGGDFVLRSIALESVEVQPAGFPVQRIALAE